MLEVSEKLKKAFMTDNVEKQFRITFPNGEHEDITNEQIEANSVSFTESLCSKDTLKFGLCEANVFKFTAECENIKGCVIKVFLDVFYQDEVFTMPYGEFTVDSCKRIAGTHLRDIEAYSEGVTDNNITLPAFQNWKCNIPCAHEKTTLLYGFEKLKRELFNEGLTDGRDATNLLPLANTVHSLNAWKPSWMIGDTNYRFEFYFQRVCDYRLKDDNLNPSNYAGDFRNINRMYQSNFEIDSTLFNYLLGKWLYFGEYMDEEQIKAKTDLLKTIVNPFFAIDILPPLPQPVAVDISDFKYPMEKGKAYYPYLPGVAQKPENTKEEESDMNTRRMCIYVPTQVNVYYRGLGIPERLERRVMLAQLKDVVFQEFAEVLPPIPIPFHNPISFFGDTFYVPADDAIEKASISTYLNGYLEVQGLFGKVDRNGNLRFFSINDNFALYPQELLYPNEDIYPVIGKNYQPLTTVSYKAADYEENETHKFGYVRATYLASDNQKYSITVECDPRYDNVYEMKDNYVLTKRVYNATQIKDLINTMFYPNIKDIAYNPANVNIKGLPFIEAGDVIKVYADYGNNFKTFVFRRTLTGEQVLTDQIEAKGEERTPDADKWIAVAGVATKE